ncbi:hypothetical protein SERLADRAFT_437404 [Serpula lacrymans var. lacrymans S7.9]|uniref:Uncharacterized protein n=1 Tax=Serpula lacrymans var. lacrymans (strain S7.9) TaxID=578457 RepID=F8NTL2_SERL9|nr:uncharacterized protein SERLADRAFT_437404 [Serpula lacrymans var. lacrymans S7.9]EGO25684.1 hypothetical protein SERLADRAFT_437404 [Serpula lacrymans var. lacrymans S7.9]
MKWVKDVSGSSPNGIDAGIGLLIHPIFMTKVTLSAGAGAYQKYLTDGTTCSSTNQSLPTDIQAAVCKAGIKLDDSLYDIFWDDGAW